MQNNDSCVVYLSSLSWYTETLHLSFPLFVSSWYTSWSTLTHMLKHCTRTQCLSIKFSPFNMTQYNKSTLLVEGLVGQTHFSKQCLMPCFTLTLWTLVDTSADWLAYINSVSQIKHIYRHVLQMAVKWGMVAMWLTKWTTFSIEIQVQQADDSVAVILPYRAITLMCVNSCRRPWKLESIFSWLKEHSR